MTLIETDSRGRASLGHPGKRYILHEEPDGTLILEPAVVMTELERRFMENAVVQAQIADAKDHPEERRKRTPRNAR